MIKNKLDLQEHGGDYGQSYIHRTENKILIVLGDADFCVGLDKLFPGFDVEIECECLPEDDDPDWLLVSYGTEVYENVISYGFDSPYESTIEKHVKLLSLEEYALYLAFFKQLKD